MCVCQLLLNVLIFQTIRSTFLNRHKKIHIREKKYDLKTKNVAAFRKHENCQSPGLIKERIHTCKVCGKAFICRCFVGNRLTHYKKNISCSLCEKSLSYEENAFQKFQSEIDRPSSVPWVMTREQSIANQEVMSILEGGEDIKSDAILPNDHTLMVYLRNKDYKQLWLSCSCFYALFSK